MEAIIVQYGALAILLGAGIEGEPFALAGGVLVHHRLLPWWEAVGAAIVGSCLVDQFWFHLSRRFRSHRWVVAIACRPAFARAIGMLDRHPVWFVLFFRFAYGLRTVFPVAIGASRVRTGLFVPLNLLAAVAWGVIFTGAGYLAGPGVEGLAKRLGPGLAVGVVVLSAGAIIFSLRRGQHGSG